MRASFPKNVLPKYLLTYLVYIFDEISRNLLRAYLSTSLWKMQTWFQNLSLQKNIGKEILSNRKMHGKDRLLERECVIIETGNSNTVEEKALVRTIFFRHAIILFAWIRRLGVNSFFKGALAFLLLFVVRLFKKWVPVMPLF